MKKGFFLGKFHLEFKTFHRVVELVKQLAPKYPLELKEFNFNSSMSSWKLSRVMYKFQLWFKNHSKLIAKSPSLVDLVNLQFYNAHLLNGEKFHFS